ncbi:MAG: hypothetical protein ACM3XO_00435 [Bacteroidota bacterium]
MTPKEESSFTSVKRKTLWIITVIALIGVLGGYFYYSKILSASRTTVGAQTQTTVVRPGDLTVSASGTGMLIAGADGSFGFGTSGQISNLDAKMGDTVEARQLIGHLHPIEALRYE